MLGAKVGDLKLYKYLKCAIKKANELKTLFPMYKNIAILRIANGDIDSIVDLI